MSIFHDIIPQCGAACCFQLQQHSTVRGGSFFQSGEALFPSSKLDMACSSSVNNSVLEKKKLENTLEWFCHLLLLFSFTLKPDHIQTPAPAGCEQSLCWHLSHAVPSLPTSKPPVSFAQYPLSKLPAFCQVELPQILKHLSKFRTRTALLITNTLGFTELLRLDKTCKFTKSSLQPKHLIKCHICFRDSDSTIPLGSQFQCLATLLGEEYFPNTQSKPSWLDLRPFPLILVLVAWERRLSSS